MGEMVGSATRLLTAQREKKKDLLWDRGNSGFIYIKPYFLLNNEALIQNQKNPG